MFTLTCFADEISLDINEQVKILNKCNIRFMELRSVNDINVLDLSDKELKEIRNVLKENNIGISCIGSPLGKVFLEDDFDVHIEKLKRALFVADFLDTEKIRVFSFYSNESNIFEHKEEVINRLGKMTEIAANAKIKLLHENEIDIYGSKSKNCYELVKAINSPYFKLVFDPSNFASAKEKPIESLELIKEYVEYVHIKDINISTDMNVLAGTGDAMIQQILQNLPKDKDLFLSLEPHLQHGGQFRGFTGPDKFIEDYRALVEILNEYRIEFN